MNGIYHLWRCGCYANKFPVPKQLAGNSLPLTTTSAIIDLTIIVLLRKELQHGDCANRHGLPDITHRPFFRALDFSRQHPADRRNNTQHKRGMVAPHSADTENNRHHQLPYHRLQFKLYIIVFSTSTRAMERNYFPNIFNSCF